MAQSYKIFINETPVYIIEGGLPATIITSDTANPVFTSDQKKDIDKAFYLIENNAGIKSLTIYGHGIKAVKKSLFADYKTIRAAGGLVFNNKDEVLMIFRRAMWDLPKGKIDLGEKKKAAALREVREETGLQKLSIVKKLRKTYHTYRLENSTKVLKVTHWYLMMCSDNAQPIPQQEEDIEVATWIPAAEVDQKLNRAYANIRDIITSGINTMHHG
jgi:8-oxo-dGTP pyrophosphatase MutT (NUDIX family)